MDRPTAYSTTPAGLLYRRSGGVRALRVLGFGHFWHAMRSLVSSTFTGRDAAGLNAIESAICYSRRLNWKISSLEKS